MTELVIFDCDGVLVDSEPIAIRIDVEMFAEVGITVSEQDIIDRFVGRSPEVLVRAVEEHLGHPPPEGWEERGEQRLRAAFAASMPGRLSSTTRHWPGAAPRRRAACRNRSGAGLPCGTSTALNTASANSGP